MNGDTIGVLRTVRPLIMSLYMQIMLGIGKGSLWAGGV